MDLLLRSRGPDVGARAPLWAVRLCGALLAVTMVAVADRLGFSEVTGFPPMPMRLVAMLVGAFVAPTAFGSVLWWLSGLMVLVSMLVAFTPLVRAPALHFVRRDGSNVPVDAVVVLSGAMTDDGRLAGQAVDRLLSAVAEARRRNVSTIALSVLTRGTRGNRVSSESDQRQLLALLAPDLTVRLVGDVASTRDEALMFAALANTYHWRRVVAVTSPMHSRRACRTIEVAGLPVLCAPADSREYSLSKLRGASERLDAFRDVMYESAATLLYSIRGWN